MKRNSRRAFQFWSKEYRSSVREFLTTGPVLDKVFTIPLGGSIKLCGPPFSGVTAVSLEIASIYQQANGVVYYINFDHSLYSHRLDKLNLDRLYLPEVRSRHELLKFANDIGHEPCLIVIDKLRNIREDWNTSQAEQKAKRELRSICTNSTLLFSSLEPLNGKVEDAWDVVLRLSPPKYHWVDGFRVGHTSTLTGNIGSQEIFISHITGRIHQPYLYIKEQELLGKSRNSVFTINNENIQGFWNFVYTTALREKNDKRDL